MLRTLDKVYVNLRDRLTRSAVERGFAEGHRAGQRAMKGAIMTNLIDKAPLDFKCLELKLGYLYAEGIAKDTKL
jgi:hypothetical protein